MSYDRDFKICGYTVGQAPNLPLITVIVSSIVGRVTEQGSLTNRFFESLFVVGLTIWSYLETFHGVNLLRRAFGLIGFSIVITHLVGKL